MYDEEDMTRQANKMLNDAVKACDELMGVKSEAVQDTGNKEVPRMEAEPKPEPKAEPEPAKEQAEAPKEEPENKSD